ncbi:MAG: hypothetical protein KDC26_10970 [Armatimonadetes bacterium]|nr:hypothetical protein [Armatimonadota bacterium]
MGKGLGFLVVGVAIGFVLGTVSKKLVEEKENDPERLADNLEEQLNKLEERVNLREQLALSE